MKKDKRFSLRLRTYYLLIIAIVVIISFGAVVGALTALQQLGVIGHINVSTLVALLLVAAAASGSASFLVGRRVLAPMVKLSKASREVARGNYSITVEDPSKLEEVQTTLRNFNALVREMNRINNVTNDFVSSVSHEFKTPLISIRGFAKLLQNDDLTPQQRRAYTDTVVQQSQRLAAMSTHILELAQYENTEIISGKTRYSLDEQLRRCVRQQERDWLKKGLTVEGDLDPVEYYGSEELVEHIWSNLLSNAIRFTPDGGQITVVLRQGEGAAHVSISDTGVGMDEETSATFSRNSTAPPPPPATTATAWVCPSCSGW